MRNKTLVTKFKEISSGQEQQTPSLVYTLTPTTNNAQDSTNYSKGYDFTLNGIKWNVTGNSGMNPWRIGGKSITNTDRTVYSKTAIANQITKIELTVGAASNITVNSLTVIVATDSNFNNVVSTLTPTFKANSTITIECPSGTNWTGCYFKFVFNVTNSTTTNRFIEFKEVKFTGYSN